MVGSIAAGRAGAYAYVFFTGTVVYALVEGTADYDALSDDLGAAMTIHGVRDLGFAGMGAALLRAPAVRTA
jgi:hypothetical protein